MSREPSVPEGYNDGHRAFLNALMARGSITFSEAQPILAAIMTALTGNVVQPDAVTMEEFDVYISIAREAVDALDFDIKSTRHQLEKERIWALINTHSDPSTQLATIHTADEIAFLKRMLDAMFETFNTPRMEVIALTEAQALKLARPPRNRQSNGTHDGGEASQSDKGLKHSEILALLPSLVAEGWLERSNSGFYSLSPRALLELHSWLLATYNDPDAEDGDWQRVKTCEACKDVLTIGQRCGNPDCLVRIHDICQQAYWRTQGVGEKKCPKCRTVWTAKHFVGERAVTQTAAYQKTARVRGGGRRSDLVDSIIAQQEAGEQEPVDEEDVEDEE